MNIVKKGSFALMIALIGFMISPDVMAQKVKKQKKKKKKVEEVVEPVEMPTPWVTKENKNGCLMYGADSAKAVQSISLYRESFKQDNYTEAMPHWEYVYNNAPGLREQTYKDGETMFRKLFEDESDEAKKAELFDKLMEIYDNRAICWGKSDYLSGKKGLLYAQYYPDGNDPIILDFLEKSIDNGGNETSYTVLYPFFVRVVNGYVNKEYNGEQVEEVYDKVKAIADYNVANNEAKSAKFQAQLDKIEPLYEKIIAAEDAKETLELANSVNDCATAKSYYGTKYRENPSDQQAMVKYYSVLKKFRCTGDSDFLEVAIKVNEIEPTAGKTKYIASAYQKKGDYTQAESFFNKAYEMATTPKDKADIKMKLAYMYAYKVKNTGKAIGFAREAAAARSNWGDPWILIGNIYAGTASSCGGFDGRACIWAAMDMWGKAKRVDPASSNKAQDSINKFYSSMPAKKDCFGMGLNPGDSYTVKCLGVTTSVRWP